MYKIIILKKINSPNQQPRSVIKVLHQYHLLQLSTFMLDEPLMLQVNLSIVDIHVSHPQGNKFVTGMKIKVKEKLPWCMALNEVKRDQTL